MVKTILLYLSLFFLVATQVSYAQRLVYERPFTVSSTYATLQGEAQQEITPTISIKNRLNRKIELNWEKRKTMTPKGWHSVLCAHKCSTPFTEKGTFSLGGYETLADFKMVFRPNGTTGIGTIEVAVYDPLDRKATETVITFSAAAQNERTTNSNTITQLGNKTEGPKVYPNPAIEYFMLDNSDNNVRHLEVYNIIGRKLLNFSVKHNGEKYDVSNLPKGMYMVRMLDTNGNIIRTQRISKYNP
ncbi:MAG: T9SS type A sorting domain-containing protein [Aureispira sp.]|nr:T9SS type A sorting domain-containing protein [Aureispira sp.]